MKYALRMTEAQHATLRNHLFPSDGNEAVALMLCGRAKGATRHIFTVRKIVAIPYGVCDRHPDRITWPTHFVDNLVQEAYGKGQAIVKVHSHPGCYQSFSETDNLSDRSLYAAVTSLLDDELPHASLIMLPDGFMFGRAVGDEGRSLGPLASVMSVGDEISVWAHGSSSEEAAFTLRQAQAFGSGTTHRLRNLAIAVVGCSGTGSIVVEQLARLGVGRLVLIDPDVVEEKNLSRILSSGKKDAYLRTPKVNVLASAIAYMGLGQEVVPICDNLIAPVSVSSVAECDIVFGCMDGAEGRHVLNRLASFYTLPYFDVGVRLDADGKGGIESIAGAVHYLQPGLSSLLSRSVYDMTAVDAEAMRRTNPELYRSQVREGYLRGVVEDRPAVVSVNMFFAALAVNDFLARLHPYRNRPNSEYAYIGGSLSELQFYPESESETCGVLQRHVGKGDTVPLLERPELS
jgi:hypothetical protein